ncbi:MAG: hypothetical protein MJZ50_10470, partial [Treponema sp.]|nr:hypothetical protein [Treponema sp.]
KNGKMVLSEMEMNGVVGGLDSYNLKYSESDYAESGVIAQVIKDGKSYSPDVFKNVRGYKVTFSMVDASGVSHEINSDLAEKAMKYHKEFGSQLFYEDLNNVFDDLK